MKKLLLKEFNLAMHPTNLIFLSFSAMLLIPNYLYYTIFFYTSLAVFFLCLSGRENHDIYYSMMLPVRKRDIVTSRFSFVVILELLQILLAIPFAIIRQNYPADIVPGNQAGIDANIAFFGVSLLMLGLFNFVFFTSYYKNTDKVGTSFLRGTIAEMLVILLAETSVHAVPYVKNNIDTPDNAFLGGKLVILFVGIVAFVLFSVFGCKKSIRLFEQSDM